MVIVHKLSAMFIPPLVSILTLATIALAQFSFTIVRPSEGEYLQLGGTFPVQLHVSVRQSTHAPLPSNTPTTTTAKETTETKVQFSLCTEITGLPACNNTMGTIILTAPFTYDPPDQTFNITIPGNQKAGLTRLVAGRLANGSESLMDKTMTYVYLGSRT